MQVEMLFGSRMREEPRDAQTPGHRILLRGGYVQQIAQGIFSLLPLGVRACRKVERVVREEMNRVDGQEVSMPVVCPAELWEESGRYQSVGPELVRFKDRDDRPHVLGMTHEELAVELARKHVRAYRQLPLMIYQIQTKFRDEPRSRAGLIRVREFVMKDAYSFHRTSEDLDAYYERCREAYARIFRRCGLVRCVDVASDTGMMGGAGAHEFMLLTPVGEDTLLLCSSCGYRANREVARSARVYDTGAPAALTSVPTPGARTIEDLGRALGVAPTSCAKAVLLVADAGRPIVAFLRGDLELNLTKLRKHARFRDIRPMQPEEATAAGLVAGFVGLHGLAGNAEVYVDESIPASANLVTGGNAADIHYTGFDYARDADVARVKAVADLAEVRDGEPCPNCRSPLKSEQGVEVGNIFKLGVKYSEAMKMTYAEEDGSQRTPIMGCYGIGVGRTMACVVEEHHDEKGPLWPISVAPYEVEVVGLGANEEAVRTHALDLHAKLVAAGVEALVDTRAAGAGVLLADADLVGAPVRVIVSRRNLKDDSVEISYRTTGGVADLPTRAPLAKAAETVAEIVRTLRARFAP
jgi:prolyl-tRNA synthetase